jgi:hypothetical protein
MRGHPKKVRWGPARPTPTTSTRSATAAQCNQQRAPRYAKPIPGSRTCSGMDASAPCATWCEGQQQLPTNNGEVSAAMRDIRDELFSAACSS